MNPNPKNSIPGSDDVTRVELPNGIIVLARPNFNSPSVFFSGYLAVGSLFNEDEKLGLADFTASALMRGTAKRDFQQLYDDMESVGAGLGFSGGTHTTGFSGRSLVEDLDTLLGILSETLRLPAFKTKEVEKLRTQIMTGLALREQSTKHRAAMAFDTLVYPGHPYSRPDEGHPHTVKTIKANDLKTFHKAHYGPRGMVISIVGGIDPQEAVDKVRRALGDWQNPKQPAIPELPPWKPLTEMKSERVEVPGKSQSEVIIGTAGPPRRAPDYIPAVVGNNIFGQFGMMGRIGEIVREKSGLAYYAYSSLGGSPGPGPWTVTVGVNPKDEEKVVAMVLEEIRRFVTGPVTKEELSDTQANFIGRMPLALESNGGVASSILHIERHQLGLDYYRKYPDMIQAVTQEDVLAAASYYLDPDRLAVAIAGPPAGPAME